MSTKESTKELKERLYHTKPYKLSPAELARLSAFISEDTAKALPKEKGRTTRRADNDWTKFMGEVGKRLQELGLKANSMKFASYLKTQEHYPLDEEGAVPLSDKELKKQLKVHLAEEAKAKAEEAKAKAADSSDSSSSEEEAPKPKPKAKAKAVKPKKEEAKAVDLSDSEEEAPKPKAKAVKPKKEEAKAVDLSDSEEEAPKPKEEEKPKPKAKKAKEEGPVLPTNGKGLPQMIGDTHYYTANVEGELAVYKLKEDGTGGEGLGIYNFTTKKIETEEEEK